MPTLPGIQTARIDVDFEEPNRSDSPAPSPDRSAPELLTMLEQILAALQEQTRAHAQLLAYLRDQQIEFLG